MKDNNDLFSSSIINLSNKKINNVDNILGTVNDPSLIKEIILNDNMIGTLPNDLSHFVNVEYINLENNPLTDVYFIIILIMIFSLCILVLYYQHYLH